MRKYLEVLKLQFKLEMSFRLDIFFGMLFTVLRVLFAMIVWPAVFGEQTEIGGFTLPMMLSFYVLTSFIAGLDSSEGIAWEISHRVRQGTFTKFLIIPADTETYLQAQTFGVSALYVFLSFLVSVIWVVLFQIPIVITGNIHTVFAALGMVVLGLAVLNQINFLIGIMAFKFLDISTFLMLKNNMVAFLTGTLLPLSLLPVWLQNGMRFFPFYYVNNLPAMLLIGCSEDEILTGYLVLLCWCLGLFVLNRGAFKVLRKKYDGVGV
jgi:ABC-type uncharacterized transport system, permease component